MWDDQYLYAGVRVNDGNLVNDSNPGNPWDEDSVEVYVDGDHTGGAYSGPADDQFNKGWNNPVLHVNYGTGAGVLHDWSTVTGGYEIELAIPWSLLQVTPADELVIGFDIGINDDDNGSTRDGQLMGWGTVDNWQDTTDFGDLTLKGEGGEPPPPPPPPGEWPGNGKSGVNANNEAITIANIEAFCTWRGRACEVTNTPTARNNWDSMTGPGGQWLFDRFAGWPGQLTQCANGDFNQHWQNFGTLLTNNGRADSIVRLGWEFNGDWTPWAATDTQAWIDCYRNAAQNIRVTAPQVTFDWTIGAHWHSAGICGGVSTNCYPGDDVVDIIGIDNYDMGPSASTLAEFNQIAEDQEGLTWLYDFAVAHGKPFSVGEWGIAPGSEFNDTGENPPFIQWMHDWFAERASNLAYEAYFNACTPGGVESNLHRPVSEADNCVRLNSNAGALYQSLFND